MAAAAQGRSREASGVIALERYAEGTRHFIQALARAIEFEFPYLAQQASYRVFLTQRLELARKRFGRLTGSGIESGEQRRQVAQVHSESIPVDRRRKAGNLRRHLGLSDCGGD